MKELNDSEISEENGVPSKEVLLRKKFEMANLERVRLIEEISWQQKLRILWLKDGDKCTNFCQTMTNSHVQSNANKMFNLNNCVISPPEIQHHIVHNYESLIIESTTWRPNLDGLAFESLDSQTARWLKRPFTKMRCIMWLMGCQKIKLLVSVVFL